MSVRCRFGHHKVMPTRTVTEHPFPGCTTYTNAICMRCKKRLWRNWYPLPEQQASVGSTSDGVSS